MSYGELRNFLETTHPCSDFGTWVVNFQMSTTMKSPAGQCLVNMVTGEGTQIPPKELLPKCPGQCQLFALDLDLHTKSLKPMWFGQCCLRQWDTVRAERAVGSWARPWHTVGPQCVLSIIILAVTVHLWRSTWQTFAHPQFGGLLLFCFPAAM